MGQFENTHRRPVQTGSFTEEELSALKGVQPGQNYLEDAQEIATFVAEEFKIQLDDAQVRNLAQFLVEFGKTNAPKIGTLSLLAVREILVSTGSDASRMDPELRRAAGQESSERVGAFLHSIESANLPEGVRGDPGRSANYVIEKFVECFSDRVLFPQHRSFILSALAKLEEGNHKEALNQLYYASDCRSRFIDERHGSFTQLTESFASSAIKAPFSTLSSRTPDSPLWKELETKMNEIVARS